MSYWCGPSRSDDESEVLASRAKPVAARTDLIDTHQASRPRQSPTMGPQLRESKG